PGKYVVTYTNGSISKQATITVEEKQAPIAPDTDGNISGNPTDSPENPSLDWPVDLGTTDFGESSWLPLEPTNTGEFPLVSSEGTDLTLPTITPIEENEWERDSEIFPQTGEQKNNLWVGLGSVFLFLGIGGLFLRKHSKR
ncbi:LPXTG cell wall anchor domain-containing protein, partial [Enterococcus sp. C76]|uniref:LPXTG cell wall anchor domain-containing protein n=1 Tax=Enterococcus sp. C76 TaxID=3231334 RepID=UPI0034A003E3